MTSARPGLVGLLLVLLAAACTGCSGDPSQVPPEVRAAAIRAARETVAEPAGDLATAAAAVTAAVESLRTDPPLRPEDRLDAAGAVRQELIAQLDTTIAAARDAELSEETADVAAAQRVWDDLRDRAERLRAAAVEEVDALQHAASLDAALAALAAGWDEAGSRSQQLAHFSELAEEADELAAEAADADDVGDCLATFERRREAAVVVGERTVELRELVAGYRGDEFDALRSEYRQDPLGRAVPLSELDADQADCWREVSPLLVASGEFEDALDRLEAALNPDDLG